MPDSASGRCARGMCSVSRVRAMSSGTWSDGCPATEVHPCHTHLAQGAAGITDAVRGETQVGEGAGGAEPEPAQSSRALVVAPVADPEHVGIHGAVQGTKTPNIGGLVERPRRRARRRSRGRCARRESPKASTPSKRSREAGDGVGVAEGTMMRVVEQRRDVRALGREADQAHHLGVVPLVDQHRVGAGQRFADGGSETRSRPVAAHLDGREVAGEAHRRGSVPASASIFVADQPPPGSQATTR